MAVKPGYKQTEVGIIPEEWEVVAVERLVEERTLAKPLDGNHGNIHPKSSDYVYHGIPFVMANNFSNGHVNFENCKFITKERADKLQKGFSVSGDVLLTHKGTVGNTAIVGELSTDYIMLTPQVTYYRVLDANSLNNNFLRHYFDSQSFQSLFTSLAGGGTRAYLGIVKQLALPIIMPPIKEQRAIAAVLSDVDALLGALERLISKKRNLKQAAMQQLLTGQSRLPGFHGEWEVKRLGEMAEIVMGQSPSSSNYNSQGDGLPLIQGNADIANRKTIKRVFTTQITKRGRAGDTLMSVRAPVGEVSRATFDLCIGRGVCAIRYPNDFLYHYLIFLEPMWGKHSKGSTFESVNSTDVKVVEVQLPSDFPEQTAIAAVLSDMDDELAALKQRLDKTRALKQGMMQELLTGRTRLL
ncbi:restriction endonuclease subunit S [Pseudomonas sp.]|uniref:restriction endonuclease subunit S n=1 Tax=Pseudomonas sp. TaxID=306 RepID=UPI002625B63A|nr:restriction endonuclease subunit S [Pseudomonas sp.]